MNLQRISILLPALALAGLVACDSTSSYGSSQAALTAADQIARGGELYAATCARCHGSSGQGTDKGPLVVGQGALPLHPRAGQKRSGPFRTAADVANFVVVAMPPDEDVRQEIQPEDYWAVLAFALSANGVQLEEPVSPDNAASIVLHP